MSFKSVLKNINSVLKLRRIVLDFREGQRQHREPLSFFRVELEMGKLTEGILLCGVWLRDDTTIPTYKVSADMPIVNISGSYPELQIFLTDNNTELEEMKGSILALNGHPEIDADKYTTIPGHHVLGFLTRSEVKAVDEYFRANDLHVMSGIEDYFMTLTPGAKESLLAAKGVDIISHLHKDLRKMSEFYYECRNRKKNVVIIYCPGYQDLKNKEL